MNRPVKFTLQSKDVLHDFWVPAFRMKKDAVPGINVDLSRHAEPRRPLPDRLRRAVRPRPRHDARHRRRRVRGEVRRVPGRRPRTRRRPRPHRPPEVRHRTASSSSRPTAAAATHWPTPAPTARRARSSTRSSRAWTWPRSGRDRRSGRRGRRWVQQHHARGLRTEVGRCGLDALAEYLSEVTKEGADDGSTARTRIPRAGFSSSSGRCSARRSSSPCVRRTGIPSSQTAGSPRTPRTRSCCSPC